MPELPEVEIVCRNLSDMLKPGSRIKSWKFFRRDLRFKIPQYQLKKIVDKPLLKIERRAKYILFNFGDLVMISHFGMTGSWRREKSGWIRKKHDHLAFAVTGSEYYFVFEDPRRFGFIEVVKTTHMSLRFGQLVVEPLAADTDFAELTHTFKSLSSPIKSALMNQKYVVGVGNIYASEVLFRAGVNPLKKCSTISAGKYKFIWNEVVKLLNESIRAGGSTIENYRNSYGEMGQFQKVFSVYGRKGQACLYCESLIKCVVQSGRSTFWCPKCQKK